MKAGILTLHEADNYGAVLQAYALQKVLTRLGVWSECITFEKEIPQKEKGRAEAGKLEAFAKLEAFTNQLREKGDIRQNRFQNFRKTYLRCSLPCEKQEADRLNNQYDFFIAGSDQIWNFSIPAVDGRYFLPFALPEKRFSYAASFGGNAVPDKVREWCGRQLKDFQSISVREKEGQEMVKALTGRDSIVCVDPVFLLEREVWEELACESSTEPYVLLYLVQYDKQSIEWAHKLADEKGCDLRIVTASFMYACGFESWCGVEVKEWLSLINGAECVITDSFHGVAFSMIFGRPFSFTGLKNNLVKRNVRVEELLKAAGVEKWAEEEMFHISEHKFAACMDGEKQRAYDYLRGIKSGV